jgi:hypothetical protein
MPAQRFYERHGFIAVERTDGSSKKEHEPDIRYVCDRRTDISPFGYAAFLRDVLPNADFGCSEIRGCYYP